MLEIFFYHLPRRNEELSIHRRIQHFFHLHFRWDIRRFSSDLKNEIKWINLIYPFSWLIQIWSHILFVCSFVRLWKTNLLFLILNIHKNMKLLIIHKKNCNKYNFFQVERRQNQTIFFWIATNERAKSTLFDHLIYPFWLRNEVVSIHLWSWHWHQHCF